MTLEWKGTGSTGSFTNNSLFFVQLLKLRAKHMDDVAC